MNLFTVLIVAFFAGVIAWLVGIAPFIDAQFKAIIRWVIIAVFVLWLLLGIYHANFHFYFKI